MKYSFQTGSWEGQLRNKHRDVEISSWHGVKYVHVVGVSWKNETEKQEETSCCFQRSIKHNLSAALLHIRSRGLIPHLMIGILQDKQVSKCVSSAHSLQTTLDSH